MNKISVFILLFIYTTVNCGLNVSLHYCGGKLKSISLLNKDDEKGCCGKKMKSKNCCKNKTAVLKIKDTQQKNEVSKINSPEPKLISVITTELLFHLSQPNSLAIAIDHHVPPVIYDNPIYLKNRVLII